MDKYTPGPWVIAENSTKLTATHPLRKHQYDIVTIHYAFEHGQHEANAKLIAAAPDLLKSLSTLERWLSYAVKDPSDAAYASILEARAALKKAGYG